MCKIESSREHPGCGARVGVFLCECGTHIAGKVHLAHLQKNLNTCAEVDYAQVLPYGCMLPGLNAIRQAVSRQRLDGVIVAGCERRLLLGKFEAELLDSGLVEGQIDVVNIRGYVAAVNHGTPEMLADKGAKLICAAAAGIKALVPSQPQKIDMKGPVMILGGGIASYTAAQEFARNGIEALMALDTESSVDEIRILHERYPGERQYHERLTKIITEVDHTPLVRRIAVGELQQVLGRVGDYTVTFAAKGGGPPRVYAAGAIIAALDAEMLNQGSEFGHDGTRVLCHTELEEYIWTHGVPHHRLVFWISEADADQPFVHLSARCAWRMATYIRAHNTSCTLTILHKNAITVPLSAAERRQARQMDIRWIPYDPNVRPTVQEGYIIYDEPDSQIERELPWDQLVLSPKRHPGAEQLKVARILGLEIHGDGFLERNPQMVRPEQVGLEEKFLAGSARKPCDLREALRQGRRAAQKTAQIIKKAQDGVLYAPRRVCTVDPSKCIGCGLCKEICDCGGIAAVDGPGGNIPRVVDPMTCTGGGTCAAACPYDALSLQNDTTHQRESRVKALAGRLVDGEIMGFGCRWGGAAAADHAGVRGIASDPRFYLLPIDCIGQLDPTVMGKAFLEGANGLLLLGCPPEACHHSYGLDHTWSRVLLLKKLLSIIGLERDRIALAHIDLNQPAQLARTVNRFMEMMDTIGPIVRNDVMKTRIQDLCDTLKSSRVRWVLGTCLRRPWETTYPGDQRNALAFDETFSDVVMEEYLRTRLVNHLRRTGKVLHLNDILVSTGEEKKHVLNCLKELMDEGLISRTYKDRVPYFALR
jgi:heterodisulfide reductase subunit A2